MAGSTGNFRTIYGGNIQYPGGLGQPFKEVFSLISIHPSALEDKLKMGTIYAPGIAGKRFIFGGKKEESDFMWEEAGEIRRRTNHGYGCRGWSR
jgi:hypothetical protein